MNAVATRGRSNENVRDSAPGRLHFRLRAAVLILLALTAAGSAAADVDSAEATADAVLVAQAALPGTLERNRPQLEISTSTLPRFEATDGASRTSRIDMTYMAPRRSALGLSLGMVSPDSAGVASMAQLSHFAPQAGMNPTGVDLGLTWRHTTDGNYRIDVSAWRRLMPADALTMIQTRAPHYGARVEMRLGGGASKRGFVAERGFLGLQLESGARVTLRRSGGKPMLYYRAKF